LVNDGFIEANVRIFFSHECLVLFSSTLIYFQADLLAIEEQWKENFTDDDINKLLNSPEYEMLLRRYSGRPVGCIGQKNRNVIVSHILLPPKYLVGSAGLHASVP